MAAESEIAATAMRAYLQALGRGVGRASEDERILQVALVLWSGDIGGAETLAEALARALRRLGVDARIIFIRHGQPLKSQLLEAGTPFEELAMNRGRSALWRYRRFAASTTEQGPDGSLLVTGGFLALALRLGGYRGRIVAVEHGAMLQTRRASVRRRLIRRLDQHLGRQAVDVQVAVSEFVRRQLPGGPCPAVTIPNGVDLDIFSPRRLAGSGGSFVIGCVSRLAVGKGVEDVLIAAREVIAHGAQLKIAGDGPERARLEILADRLGMRERVEFRGWVQGSGSVAAFWNECDIGVAAPNTWIEAFGLAAVEAMACGRPVVATRNGALRETVIEGRTGRLVESGDVEGLAAAFRSYLDDGGLVAAQGAAARAWCEERFDIKRCAAAYVDLFRGGGCDACHHQQSQP